MEMSETWVNSNRWKSQIEVGGDDGHQWLALEIFRREPNEHEKRIILAAPERS
jgi:hypothetical protein